jgi:hypothetical protein
MAFITRVTLKIRLEYALLFGKAVIVMQHQKFRHARPGGPVIHLTARWIGNMITKGVMMAWNTGEMKEVNSDPSKEDAGLDS